MLTMTRTDPNKFEKEVNVLRYLSFISLIAFIFVAVISSSRIGFTTAIPEKISLLVAGIILSTICFILVLRMSRIPSDIKEILDQTLLDTAAGFAILFDPQGTQLAYGGRDVDNLRSNIIFSDKCKFIDQIYIPDRIKFLHALELLRQGKQSIEIDIRLDKTNQFIFLRIDMLARRNSYGTLIGVIAQIRNASSEKNFYQQVALPNPNLSKIDDSKSYFFATISHELRTPLNAIIGFSEVLHNECSVYPDYQKQREYIGIIHKSGTHLLSLINRMLDVSKMNAGRYDLVMESFDIKSIIIDCKEMLTLQAQKKGIQLINQSTHSLEKIIADPNAIRQMIINLLSNAIKFTNPGGLITINSFLDEKHLKLLITDTGVGISTENLSRIGQPFLQIKNEHTNCSKGTGLGLYLVKGLVELHSGTFDITSSIGKGTSVTITLPLNEKIYTERKGVVSPFYFPIGLQTHKKIMQENDCEHPEEKIA
ncbi:putative non-motile and phage-resistance protein [Liberibacter crescens BT-1]|uniref:histidine kinase n=2 Tax=Liberibacter crescens TaxID=1273132 RepID=L0EX15_LIBCB|nr:putative non-motile and phage-resistance protein [Liberibacter crescens BT-1]